MILSDELVFLSVPKETVFHERTVKSHTSYRILSCDEEVYEIQQPFGVQLEASFCVNGKRHFQAVDREHFIVKIISRLRPTAKI